MPTITTLTERLKAGYAKQVRFDTDKILYVMGSPRKIQNAFLHDHQSQESLKAAAGGASSIYVPLEKVTRFRARSDRSTIDIGFKDEKGRSCTIEIQAPDQKAKNETVQKMGAVLEGRGFTQSNKSVSWFWLAWKPIAVALAALFFGGLLTMSQATGGINPNEIDHGTGRSGRRAKGASIIISLVANLLGFWGCLIVTLAIVAGCVFFLIRKFSNRPTVTVFAPQ